MKLFKHLFLRLKTIRLFSVLVLGLTGACNLNAQNLVQSFIESNSKGNSQFGITVTGAGDVNHDGYADVLVGADSYVSDRGRAYIYYGGSSMDNLFDVTLTGESTYCHFGNSVSGAGDVNNDGYADVIVGAYGHNTATGRAYVYYGGSNMDNIADVTIVGENPNICFGYSVSSAGDVNNDGYDDVIIGANYFYESTGKAFIFFGGSSMDKAVDVTITCDDILYNYHFLVSGAGDVNNDGYADVLVGTPDYSSDNETSGRVYVYYGGSSMDNVADVTLKGETPYHFGYSISKAGDVNNDGFDDVIVGAYESSTTPGKAYIYYGGNDMDDVVDVTLTGESTFCDFGFSVSGAGDVNNDNYDDVIVGAYYYKSSTGRSYIYYGGSSMDNVADVTLTGESTNCSFGCSVSGAGDVNNDGYADVIVGAYRYSSYAGKSYIYYGGSSMNNVSDVPLIGEESVNNYFGYSISDAGDVNNDGFDDLLVGAYGYSSSTGSAYIYYGGSSMDNVADVTLKGEGISDYFGYSVSGAGDVNNDGYDDVIVGAYSYNSQKGKAYIFYGGNSMDDVADVTMTGETVYIFFGYSVSEAGDVNNDGFNDVIIGAYGYNSSTGRAYVYYGGSNMNNVADLTLTGGGTYNNFGYSVSGAGDVNNDGYADVVVGAYGYSSYTGRAYVYYGGVSMDNLADLTLTGEGFSNYFGCSVSKAGDVNNDGYADVIVGAYKYSSFTGKAYLYYGSGSTDNVADVTLTGEGSSSKFGYSVSGAGDVNNDGYADVLVGANTFNSNTGKVYIYYGGSNMNNVADVCLTGESTSNNFGCSVSGAGDVNNDGYDEVFVGASHHPSNGKTYLYCFNPNPIVSTTTPTQIAATSTTANGELHYLGSSTITDHGFCWNTSGTPTIENDMVDLGANSETGTFSTTLTGLLPNTTYYVRAFATNSSSTVYGDELTFTTLRHDQSITFDPLAEVTYGATAINLEATSSSGLVVSYTSSNTNVATIAGTQLNIVGAGTANIIASQAGNDRYNAATDVVQTLVVNKAILSITADDKNKTYGEANPALTLTYSGFVNGDDVSDLTTAPIVSTLADATTEVGSASIIVSGGNDDNYDFSYTNGTLTIDKATLTVTAQNMSIEKGHMVDMFDYEISGYVNNDNKTDISGKPGFSVDYATVNDANEVPIVINVDAMNAVNYKFIGIDGILTILTPTSVIQDEKNNIDFYPNPIIGSQLNVTFDGNVSILEYEIISVTGLVVRHEKVNIDKKSIEVGNLKPATYFIRLITTNGLYTHKFVKL